MAACNRCKKQIARADERKAIQEKDERGRLVAIFHFKCYMVAKKHDRMGPGGRYIEESPTAYQEALRYKNATDLTPEEQAKRERSEQELAKLRERQTVIEAEREREEAPKAWDDWREPEVLDLEELEA